MIGELLNRKIKLENKGALGTTYEIINAKKVISKKTESSRLSEINPSQVMAPVAVNDALKSEADKSVLSFIVGHPDESITHTEEVKEDEITLATVI